MAYTVESVNSCTKKLVFTFDTLDLSGQIQSALKEKQKSTALKGFRKGKAPLNVVQQLYGSQVEQDALNKFISQEFFQAVQAEGLQAISYPTFSNTNYESGKSVSFDATVEIFPPIELADISHLKFSKDDSTVTDEEVAASEKGYLESKSEMVELKGDDLTLANGHFAVMNFEGVKEDGERPENMKGREFLLEIGSGQFIPGFEEGMIGMKVGEKKEVPVTFPADYQAAELQNAKVTFEVELLEIKEKKLPELTDELVKEIGFDSVEDFKKKNRQTLELQKERAAKEKLHQDILEKLVELNNFDIPNTMLEGQKNSVKEEMKRNLVGQGFDPARTGEYFTKWESELNKKAEFQVRSGLILDKLSKEYKIETSEADLTSKFNEMADQSGMKVEEIESYYTKNNELKKNLTYAIREEKTFEKIIEQVQIG